MLCAQRRVCCSHRGHPASASRRLQHLLATLCGRSHLEVWCERASHQHLLSGRIFTPALFGALFWVLADLRLLDTGNRDLVTWLILTVAATILGIGVSWSHVRRRISGQADVDDVED